MILLIDLFSKPYRTLIDPFKEPFKEPYLLSPFILQVSIWGLDLGLWALWL